MRSCSMPSESFAASSRAMRSATRRRGSRRSNALGEQRRSNRSSRASSRARWRCPSWTTTAATAGRWIALRFSRYSRACEAPMSEIIPLGHWVDQSVHYLLDHDSNTFDAIGKVIEGLAALVEHGLQAIPMWALMAFFISIGLWRVGWRFALFTTLSLLLIYATGFWDQTVVTLGLTLSSTIISLVFGIPLGIWTAKNKHVALIVRPVLDLMQTMPAFVYLIPAAMLF